MYGIYKLQTHEAFPTYINLAHVCEVKADASEGLKSQFYYVDIRYVGGLMLQYRVESREAAVSAVKDIVEAISAMHAPMLAP